MIGLQKNLGFVGDFCYFVPWDSSSCFKPPLKGDLFVFFSIFLQISKKMGMVGILHRVLNGWGVMGKVRPGL